VRTGEPIHSIVSKFTHQMHAAPASKFIANSNKIEGQLREKKQRWLNQTRKLPELDGEKALELVRD
jgi:hypothetical protein